MSADSKHVRKIIALLPLLGILLAFKRGGTKDRKVFFFSFEDLKKELSKPDLFHLSPNFSWRTRQEGDAQEGLIEHNYRWGNGLGLDGYTRPGTRPLWGY